MATQSTAEQPPKCKTKRKSQEGFWRIPICSDCTGPCDGIYIRQFERHMAKISHASVVELVDFFREASYFSLRDRYASGITDNPAYETSISFDGVSKSVF